MLPIRDICICILWGFIQPTAVYPYPQLIILVVARKRQCVYVYIIRVYSALSRGNTKHHSFQLRFYSNSCFTSAGELIHRQTLQECFFWSGSSPLTCPARETLSVATLSPVEFSVLLLRTHKPLHPIDIFGKVEALWRGFIKHAG